MPIVGVLKLDHLFHLLHFVKGTETLGAQRSFSWLVKGTFRIHSLWPPVQCPLPYHLIACVCGVCTAVIMLPL